MFNFPDDWDDDERMAFLFRDLKPRYVNPLGYDEKVDFWKKLICDFTAQKQKALRREGLIRPAKPASWAGWVSSWFVTPPTEQDTMFVNAQAFDATVKETREALRNENFTETHVPYREVWRACQGVCGNNEKLFEFVLRSFSDLSVSKDTVIFSPNSDLVRPLSEHDKALNSIREANNAINEKVDELSRQDEELRDLALKHKREGNQKAALAALRRRKRVMERIAKQYNVLDRLHQLHSDLESQKDMAKIFDGIRVATSALKTVNNDVDKIHNIVDEMQDATAEHRDIEESISNAIAPDTQLSDLEDELQQLLEETEPVPDLPSVPIEEPSSSKTKLSAKGDAEPQQKKRVPLGYFD